MSITSGSLLLHLLISALFLKCLYRTASRWFLYQPYIHSQMPSSKTVCGLELQKKVRKIGFFLSVHTFHYTGELLFVS